MPNAVTWWKLASSSQRKRIPGAAGCFQEGVGCQESVGCQEGDRKVQGRLHGVRSRDRAAQQLDVRPTFFTRSGAGWRHAFVLSVCRNLYTGCAQGAQAAALVLGSAPKSGTKVVDPPTDLKIAKRVVDVLGKGKWGEDRGKTVEGLGWYMTPHRVNMVVKRLSVNADMAWGFFNWAAGQPGFKHNGHTYYTMMNVFGRSGNFRAMEGLLETMHREGCPPDAPTYNILVKWYGRLWNVKEAVRVVAAMEASGCKPNKETFNSLLHSLAKQRFHYEAMRVYQQMVLAGCRPNNHTHAVMIRSLGASGKVQEACQLFDRMPEAKCKPKELAYGAIIEVHSKAGNVEEVAKLFKRMKEARLTPAEATYELVAETLKAAGRTEEADTVIWEKQYKYPSRRRRRGK